MAPNTAIRPPNMHTHVDDYIITKIEDKFDNNMLEVSLKVFKGEKNLCASNREMGIFTEGKNWNDLMKNIRDVIELYYDIPSADAVKINIQIDPVTNVEKTNC